MRLLAALALAFAACATAPVAPPPATVTEALRARDFYPLRVGHKWTYEVRAGGQVATRSIEILKEDGGFYRDSGGGSLKGDARGLRDPDRYLLMDPVEKGHKWSSVLSVQSTERYEIIDAGRPCEVPAGLFARCVTVRGTNAIDANRQLVNEVTYAEGVGLVEMHTFARTGSEPPKEQVSMRLVSFKLAP